MSATVIELTLRYEADGRVELHQTGLTQLTEPLIILGEAGMGKSHLLQWIPDSNGDPLCTARQLINRHNLQPLFGAAQVLVIDALDEVGA